MYTSRDAGAGGGGRGGGAGDPASVLLGGGQGNWRPGCSAGSCRPRRPIAVFAAVGHTPLGVPRWWPRPSRVGVAWAELACGSWPPPRRLRRPPVRPTRSRPCRPRSVPLPADLTEALLGLAVFPAGTGVPIAGGRQAVGAHPGCPTSVQTAADLDRLAVAGGAPAATATRSVSTTCSTTTWCCTPPPLAGLHTAAGRRLPGAAAAGAVAVVAAARRGAVRVRPPRDAPDPRG